MKIEAAYDGAVIRLFSVGVGSIFIAEDFSFPIEFEYCPNTTESSSVEECGRCVT